MPQQLNLSLENHKKSNYIRYSSPAPGRTIGNSIRPWAEKILTISAEMKKRAKELNMLEELSHFYKNNLNVHTPLIENTPTDYGKNVNLLTNAILSMWLTGVSTNNVNKNAGLLESVMWFYNGYIKLDINPLEKWLNNISTQSLCELSYNEMFLDLYPYILEIYETDNELFLKNGFERMKKREFGIYYTPSDVAYFMIKNIVEKKKDRLDFLQGEWIDPACGSGLFLKTIVEYYINEKFIPNRIEDIIRFIKEKIYGIDISRQAIQSSAFNLLTFCLSQTDVNIDRPWYYYQTIKKNLAVMDATKLNRSLIKKIFSIINDFTFFVTNPPYSKRIRGDYLYPDFIRIMWSVCKPQHSAGAIVVPLSITYNTGREFCKIREDIMNINRICYFTNFDRTPDSLFGDDVKTRNTIIFIDQNKNNKKSIFTTPLLRWNSRNRTSLFKNITHTCLENLNIKQSIPKIGTDFEKTLYFKLLNRKSRLRQDIIEDNSNKHTPNRIFVGRTSYNWLSIYRFNPYSTNDEENSYSTLFPISFKTEKDANIAYGILTSRILYWLWRVEGDGFHLNLSFIKRVPYSINDLSPKQKTIVEENSIKLWESISKKPIVSNNSKVKSITYCPYNAEENINEIDRILLELVDMPTEKYTYFKELTRSIIVCGRENEIDTKKNNKTKEL
ncbi:MAG: N-6 DNA methylase [bacterium]